MSPHPLRNAMLAMTAFSVAALALPVHAGPDVSPGNVTIVGFSFAPAAQLADATKNVTWHNEDAVAHRPIADNGCFDAGLIGVGKHSRASLSRCGDDVVTYHCSIHPFMVGAIDQ
jgi:plastocyanin